MNSSCQFWNQKVTVYSNFASLFSAMKNNSSVFFFYLISNLYALDKKSPSKWTFHTFGYLGEKSPNLLCHIWNYKSVFLQNLHHSSVSWEITLLYFFFVEAVHDLDKRSPSKCKISDFWLLTFLTFDCFCWKYIKIFTKKVQRSYVSLP